jgi:hypothetical protein
MRIKNINKNIIIIIIIIITVWKNKILDELLYKQVTYMLRRAVLRQVTRRQNHRAQTEGKLNEFPSVRAITSIIR